MPPSRFRAERGQQHNPRPLGLQRGDGGFGLLKAGDRLPGQPFQFELIGGGDISRRQRLVAQEFRNAGADKNAAPGIANDRIAAPKRLGIGRFHQKRRIAHRGTDLGRAQIARKHGIAAGQHAAFFNPRHAFPDQISAKNLAAPGAIARVVGELHRMHPPNLRPQALQREHGAGIADMPIGDPGLDGEDIEAHARRTFAIAG